MKPRKNDLDRVPLLTARDLMTQPVITLRSEMGVREAAGLLVDHNVHGAPVVEPDGRVVGVLSMTDIARYERDRDTSLQRESDWYRIAREGRLVGVPWRKGFHAEPPEAVFVREIMSPFVISVFEDASLADVVSILLRNLVHRLIVVREPGPKLVGVVSETDILVAIYSALSPEKVKAVV